MGHTYDLTTWNLAAELVVETHRVTGYFSEGKHHGMVTQIRGISIAVLCNVADMMARSAKEEPTDLLQTGVASLADMKSRVLVLEDLGLIEAPHRLHELIETLSFKLNA